MDLFTHTEQSTTHIEQSRGIRHVYKAFDTETALEVAWQEYWGVSVSSMNAIEKSIETLKSLNHKHIIKYHEGWVDRKQKKVIFITEAMPTGRGSITNVRRCVATQPSSERPFFLSGTFQELGPKEKNTHSFLWKS